MVIIIIIIIPMNIKLLNNIIYSLTIYVLRHQQVNILLHLLIQQDDDKSNNEDDYI